jgi:RHS repeat-associated protein
VLTRFRRFEDLVRKLGAVGGWLCFVLLLGVAVPTASAQTVTYIHTDALGSVVAESDANGNVIKRYDYEPYGAVVGGEVTDGPGYTGHVSDAATGLSYMQQRYMDPQLGVFLSVDPVTAHEQPVGQFNRYRYANGNPYKFKDPDGRIVETVWEVANIAMGATSAYSNFSQGNVGAGIVDSIGVAIDATAAAVPFVPGGAGAAIKAARGLEKAVDGARTAEKAGDGFDSARRGAFESAGMNDPSKVTFSKVDEKTGTVVEFKGEGGAKIGYDGPHASPGPHHDTQHISWQSSGKRGDGGAQRGNIPYSGERHPSRPDRKDQ